MRLMILATLIFGISMFPAHAEDTVTPRETVEQLYYGMEVGEDNAEIVDIPLPMTAELGDLLADDHANGERNGTGIGRLDFSRIQGPSVWLRVNQNRKCADGFDGPKITGEVIGSQNDFIARLNTGSAKCHFDGNRAAGAWDYEF